MLSPVIVNAEFRLQKEVRPVLPVAIGWDKSSAIKYERAKGEPLAILILPTRYHRIEDRIDRAAGFGTFPLKAAARHGRTDHIALRDPQELCKTLRAWAEHRESHFQAARGYENPHLQVHAAFRPKHPAI